MVKTGSQSLNIKRIFIIYDSCQAYMQDKYLLLLKMFQWCVLITVGRIVNTEVIGQDYTKVEHYDSE